MPEDQALNFSDSIGGRVAHVLVDDLVNFSDSIGVVIRPPTATAHAVALAPEVKVTASVEEVVIRGKRSIQVGLVPERVVQVGLAAALSSIYEVLRAEGLPPMDALLIMLAVASYCLIRLADD
jgi:hypothetical protein